MSAETLAALEAALRDHIADIEDGALMSGYVMVAAAVPIAEDERDLAAGLVYYPCVAPEGQPHHVGLGLAYQIVDSYRRF